MGMRPDQLPGNRPSIGIDGSGLVSQGDRIRRADLGSMAFLERAFEPTDVIEIDDVKYNVPPIILESQGPIQNQHSGLFEEYMGDDYDGIVKSLVILEQVYWEAHNVALPRIKGDGYAYIFGMGTGLDMEAVLKTSPGLKVAGFDMAISGMEIARKKFAQVSEYAGRTAFMQADLGQPLIRLPKKSAIFISARAVDLFMSEEEQQVMYNSAAEAVVPGGLYHANNLVQPFATVMKGAAIYEASTNPQGVARIMQSQKYARQFDIARESGAMHATSVEQQTEMLHRAGFAEVRVSPLMHPAFTEPIAATVIAIAPE